MRGRRGRKGERQREREGTLVVLFVVVAAVATPPVASQVAASWRRDCEGRQWQRGGERGGRDGAAAA